MTHKTITRWLPVALSGAAPALALAAGLFAPLGWLALAAWALAVVLTLEGGE